MTDAAIVAHISQLPHSRANFKQLVRELGAKSESRNQLEAALTRLAARGDLIELKSGHYVGHRPHPRIRRRPPQSCIAMATAS